MSVVLLISRCEAFGRWSAYADCGGGGGSYNVGGNQAASLSSSIGDGTVHIELLEDSVFKDQIQQILGSDPSHECLDESGQHSAWAASF